MSPSSNAPDEPPSEDPGEDVPFGDALRELAVDVDVDAEAVRDIRERM